MWPSPPTYLPLLFIFSFLFFTLVWLCGCTFPEKHRKFYSYYLGVLHRFLWHKENIGAKIRFPSKKCILLICYWQGKKGIYENVMIHPYLHLNHCGGIFRCLSLSIKKYRYSVTPDFSSCWLSALGIYFLVTECTWLVIGWSSTQPQTLLGTISLRSEIASVVLNLNTHNYNANNLRQQRPLLHLPPPPPNVENMSCEKTRQSVHIGIMYFYSTGLARGLRLKSS